MSDTITLGVDKSYKIAFGTELVINGTFSDMSLELSELVPKTKLRRKKGKKLRKVKGLRKIKVTFSYYKENLESWGVKRHERHEINYGIDYGSHGVIQP